jgi:hypothetical protein
MRHVHVHVHVDQQHSAQSNPKHYTPSTSPLDPFLSQYCYGHLKPTSGQHLDYHPVPVRSIIPRHHDVVYDVERGLFALSSVLTSSLLSRTPLARMVLCFPWLIPIKLIPTVAWVSTLGCKVRCGCFSAAMVQVALPFKISSAICE